MNDPGKYDEACTTARESTKALGCLLIIISGERGHGFSMQATEEIARGAPEFLRQMADQIEAEMKRQN